MSSSLTSSLSKLTSIKLSQWWSLERGQGPAPTSKFAGDGDVSDHIRFLAFVEATPLLMQPAVAGVPACLDCRVNLGPPGAHRGPGIAVGRAMMPGRLDQQAPDVGVARLGDRTLHPRGP